MADEARATLGDAVAPIAASDQSLSLAFMRSHPAAAARVLDALPLTEAATLFQHAPARVSAAVLAEMLPRQGAACLALLPESRALELLAPLGTQATVLLLRHLPEAQRTPLVAGLPTAAALASALLLGFAEDTCGAWADPDVVTLGGDTLASDALQRLRAASSAQAMVFVLSATRRLNGVVPVLALLRAAPHQVLAGLMQPPAALLSAQATLSSAATHPGWAQATALPVLEPGERLVGVMTRPALARALRHAAAAPEEPPTPTTLSAQLMGSYWQALAGLLGAGLGLLPRVRPVMGAADEP